MTGPMAKKKNKGGRPKIHDQPQVRLNLWVGKNDRELLRAAAGIVPGRSHAGLIVTAVREYVERLPAGDRKRVLAAMLRPAQKPRR